MRKRLFGDKKNELKSESSEQIFPISSSRSFNNKAKKTEDAKLLSHEEVEHEQLANELLRLTTTMKQQFQVSGAVLREDNAVIFFFKFCKDSFL